MSERRWTVWRPEDDEPAPPGPGPMVLHVYAGPTLKPGERLELVEATAEPQAVAMLNALIGVVAPIVDGKAGEEENDNLIEVFQEACSFAARASFHEEPEPGDRRVAQMEREEDRGRYDLEGR